MSKTKALVIALSTTASFPNMAYAQVAASEGRPVAGQQSPAATTAASDAVSVDAGATTQEAKASAENAEQSSGDIVVTGTLLRGIAPVGTNVVGLDRQAILRTGSANANEVLAQIPQISNYFNTQVTPAQGYGSPLNVPNIRNLGGSGGVTTLLLLNGRRTVGEGVLNTIFDPANIPPGALERVDVVPDGGSSIYGSDAIGGVINFITRKRFNGVEVSGHYGGADKYSAWDANITAGRDWGTGSVFASYYYARNDSLVGLDRDYVRADYSNQGSLDRRSKSCNPGTITVGTTDYALPGRALGANRCDQTDYVSIFPEQERHAVYAGLTQRLSDKLTFDLTAFYSKRRVETLADIPRYSLTVNNSNPFFEPIGSETSQLVSFNLSSQYGNSVRNVNRFEVMGITPEFALDLGNKWRVRASGNFGSSDTTSYVIQADDRAVSAALLSASAADALNPYDISRTAPSVLNRVLDYSVFGGSHQELAEGRLIADGSLFEIAGGDVRLAAGAEYHYDNITAATQQGQASVNEGYFRTFSSREIKSVFGELLIPVFGPENGFMGARRLDLSASVRHDDYSDVGPTTNPKFGMSYKPFDGLELRGNWGTSFHAPSLADTGNSVDTRVQVLSSSPFISPSDSFDDNNRRREVLLAGGNPDLKPEKATTWSAGAVITPTQIKGLQLSATYWNVKFRDAIQLSLGAPNFFQNPALQPYYIINPTLAQLRQFAVPTRLDGVRDLAELYQNGQSPYAVIDARRNNFGRINTDGIDFAMSYNHETSFGSVSADLGGSYTLSRKNSPIDGAPFVDQLKFGYNRFSFTSGLAASIGDLVAQARLNHTGGAPINNPRQTHVSAFDSVNLYFSYKLPALIGQSVLTLNVDNVFDNDPPIVDGSPSFVNLGRTIRGGVRLKF